MKNKLDKKEIERLIAQYPNALMWRQRVNTLDKIVSLTFSILSSILLTLILNHYIFKFEVNKWIEIIGTQEFYILITYSSLFLFIQIVLTNRATIIEYSIYPGKIVFRWGLLRKKLVAIPFSEITSIHIVNYKHVTHSTIFFGTKKSYNLIKRNLDTGQPRVHITFEQVKAGKKVHDLLIYLWEFHQNKE